MTVNQLLAALAAAPKPFRVVTTYACGKVRSLDVISMAAGENWATGERRKIGRDLIERETGRTVRVVSVEIMEN